MDAMNVLHGDGHLVFEDGSYVFDPGEIRLSQLQPKVLTSEERVELEAYYQDPPNEFTVPWPSGAAGHDMALHRRNDDLTQSASFHLSCSCGWQSQPSPLEIDARAQGILHVKEEGRQQDVPLILRFRDHVLSSWRVRNPRLLQQNEERWIGLCACGWSYVERTETEADEAYEKHWSAPLDDPTMQADYQALLEEQDSLPEQADSLAFASDNKR
jgi:hypothetical protein